MTQLLKIGLAFATFTLASLSQAHEIRPTIVDLGLEADNRYAITFQINLEAWLANIGPEHDDTEDAPESETYNRLRALPPAALAERFETAADSFTSGVNFSADGEPLSPTLASVSVPPVGDLDLARDSTIILTGTLPAGTDQLQWRLTERFGANALRVNGPNDEALYTRYLQAGQSSDAFGLEGVTERGLGAVFVDYTVIGFEHILPKGLDHILFVVGLFLLSTRLKPLLWQITAFTVAHSVTLALGMLGIVTLSPAIVEPLIALSIVYVGVENLLTRNLSRWRPYVIFAFGLLHGLGFAGVLGEIGLDQANFVTGLVAFNIGVELGQLTVIGLCFLAVGLWFRNKEWYRGYVTNPASIAIAVTAGWWVVQRTFLG